MALTLAEAQELREAYRQALLAIATGKTYTIGSRSLSRADERFIKQQFAEYDRIVDQISSGRADGVQAFNVIPRDT